MDVLYYCGFNGFKQVPNVSGHTLNTFVVHQQASDKVKDVAVCWNYLVVLSTEGALTKYGLVDGKNGVDKIPSPKGAKGKIVQLSATPRHIMVCTEQGECWTHEEAKGWRKVAVGAEKSLPGSSEPQETDSPLIDFKEESKQQPPKKICTPESEIKSMDDPGSSSTFLVKTCSGDSHNIGLDSDGVAYSLPSPLDFDVFPKNTSHKVVDIVCGKEHCLLLTEHGQVYSWGGGSRGQLGHGTLNSEERPRLITALDGMKVKKIAAGGWHSAVISQFDDLYMFGWNESGQLAQTTNLAKPAECFTAVEKLLMACCTMQPEDSANPRGDAEDCEVYHKNEDSEEFSFKAAKEEAEKDALTCYNAATGCNDLNPSDLVVVQSVPMLVQVGGQDEKILGVACGSRHTMVLTQGNQLWGFGWNKYGQLGLGHMLPRDSVEKLAMPKAVTKGKVKMLRCGDWGTVLITEGSKK